MPDMPPPPRIAFFTDTFTPKRDGIVTVLCLLLDHLQQRGIAACVVAPQMRVAAEQRSRENRYGEAPVIRVPGLPFPPYPELTLGPPTPGTFRQLRAFAPNLVHLIHPAWLGGFGLAWAKRRRLPTVASFHLDLARLAPHYRLGPFAPLVATYTKRVFRAADLALAPSVAMQEQLRAAGVPQPALWRRGVDTARFHPRFASATMRARLSEGHSEAPLLLYVGRLSREKQLHRIRPLLDRIPEARLALVGDGPARGEMERLFAGSGTNFVGYLSGEALSQAYASADLFVFPSAQETYGLVVTEALAAGTPVVAARVGGVPEVIREGENGYSFAPDDAAGMAAGVRQALASREHLAALSTAAREFALTQSWPAANDELIGHYERLVVAASRSAQRR